jgi:hypothetical protein
MHQQPNLKTRIAHRNAVAFAATLLKYVCQFSLVRTANPVVGVDANPELVTLLCRELVTV